MSIPAMLLVLQCDDAYHAHANEPTVEYPVVETNQVAPYLAVFSQRLFGRSKYTSAWRSPDLSLKLSRMTDTSTPLTRNARIALTLILAVYGFILLRDPSVFRLIDNVDLAIHEAGHVFFGPFGEFIGFLGGTLMQLIVPLTFFGYFLHRRDQYAASVLLWWVAQNLWNISVYIKDARSMELPLVGGGVHDWRVLLGEMGLLPHDQAIGQTVYSVGVLCFLASVGWGILAALSTRGEQTEA